MTVHEVYIGPNTRPKDVDSVNWSDYEIQKNGADGAGVINFKT